MISCESSDVISIESRSAFFFFLKALVIHSCKRDAQLRMLNRKAKVSTHPSPPREYK